MTGVRVFAIFGVVFGLACASLPPPTQAIADAVASIRRAQAAGADLIPEASKQLKLAREEITMARTLMAAGKYEPAYDEALRASTDADLALALARKTEARKLANREFAAEQLVDVDARRAARAAADLAGIALVEQTTRGMVITLSSGVLFANTDDVLLPDAPTKLKRVAQVLRAGDPEAVVVVVVVVRTDPRGRSEDNRALSINRANAVRDYLIEHGIATDRITAEGHGKRRPIADNDTTANNRVEIVVEPDIGG